MFRSVLVPLDGSPFGEHALPWALMIARRAKVPLNLMLVHAPWADVALESVAFGEELQFQLRTHERGYLDDTVRRLAAVAPVSVSAVVDHGEVAPAIRGRVAEEGDDLVVMATHGRGPLGRLFLGGVADELVRTLPVPLLLVRPGAGPADLGREPTLGHILVPLDGTLLAEQALEPALALGDLAGAEFTLLRAVEPITHWPLPAGEAADTAAGGWLDGLRVAGEELLRAAGVYLNRVAERLRLPSRPVHTHTVRDESAAAAVLREAEARGAHLIAMSTHGRRGLSRALLGSVTDQVIRGAHTPVLVCRPVERH
jgi:nucleotide-binding universal stress UspA family protein